MDAGHQRVGPLDGEKIIRMNRLMIFRKLTLVTVTVRESVELASDLRFFCVRGGMWVWGTWLRLSHEFILN